MVQDFVQQKSVQRDSISNTETTDQTYGFFFLILNSHVSLITKIKILEKKVLTLIMKICHDSKSQTTT